MNQFQPMAPSAYMPMPQPYQPYQPPYQPTPARAMPQISGHGACRRRDHYLSNSVKHLSHR